MKNIKLIAVPLASTIKYEIGKRYNFYSFKDLIVFSEKRSHLNPAFFDVNRYETPICGKIYIIKINYENNDFKILKEFNYERLKNSKDTELKLVYGIKFHDNYIIDEYKKTAMKNIILSKISTENELDNIYEEIKDDLHYSYFINLILQRNFENLTKKILENKLFLTQLRLFNGLKSKIFDDLIKKNVTNLNEEVIKYGYDKHIDHFKNEKQYFYDILKRNRKQDYHLIKYLEYKYYNACLLAAIKKNDKRFLKYRKKERIISYENHKILDIMTDKELFNLYKMGGSVTKSYILHKGIKKIILLNYYEDFSSLPLNLFPNLFPNIGYKGLSQIQNKHKGEILISDNEQFLNENFNDYQKIINLSYLSFKNFISIGRKKDIDFLKDKELDSSKAELLVQHIYDLKYLKEIEQSKKSKISCIAEYSIIKNDLDRKNISFVYYFQIDKSKILKIRYSDFLREVDFSIFSKNKNKLNEINFIGFDDGNDFVIDFYKKWGLRFEPKLNDNEYVDLLNDIKQLKTKYNYLYDNDFCDFDYSEEDLKYLLKKELKTNNI